MRSAAWFQLVMVPSRFLLMMASSVESIIAAKRLLAVAAVSVGNLLFTDNAARASYEHEKSFVMASRHPKRRYGTSNEDSSTVSWGDTPRRRTNACSMKDVCYRGRAARPRMLVRWKRRL